MVLLLVMDPKKENQPISQRVFTFGGKSAYAKLIEHLYIEINPVYVCSLK